MSSGIVKILKRRTKARLVNRLLGIVFIIALGYSFRYFFVDRRSISLFLLAPFLLLPLLLWILNYFEKYKAAAIIGLLGFNITLFLVAISESTSTGVHLHFISACSVSMVVFGYNERLKSILFLCLSVSFFLISNLVPLNFITFREYSEENSRIFFIMHTLGTAIISGFAILALLNRNYRLNKGLKENESRLVDKNKALQKANEELDRFVYSASHDLRAPLASIGGLVNLMGMEKVNFESPYLEMIRNRINVMESFIRDIVHYSRNSRLELRYEEINLKLLLTEIEASVSHFDNAQLVQIKNDINPDTVIYSDLHRLRVILTNLITNGIKYADLNKHKPYVCVSYHKHVASESIEIADNGIGIEADYLPKIFNMFYRATELSKGSGLGLYIAMETAVKLNSRIAVKSEYNVGTTFTLEIQ